MAVYGKKAVTPHEFDLVIHGDDLRSPDWISLRKRAPR
jgi:hypothetical protein